MLQTLETSLGPNVLFCFVNLEFVFKESRDAIKVDTNCSVVVTNDFSLDSISGVGSGGDLTLIDALEHVLLVHRFVDARQFNPALSIRVVYSRGSSLLSLGGSLFGLEVLDLLFDQDDTKMLVGAPNRNLGDQIRRNFRFAIVMANPEDTSNEWGIKHGRFV